MGSTVQGVIVALMVGAAVFFLGRRYWPGRPGCDGDEGKGGCNCGRDD
ncbi:MAG TPA: hypothetical protein VGM87_15335 [Roseomonas sp.]